MTPDTDATLLARLLQLRADALQQLAAADTLDGGLMRLVADAGAALAALEDEAAELAGARGGAGRCRVARCRCGKWCSGLTRGSTIRGSAVFARGINQLGVAQ
jgi:hypothetical protein